MFKTMKLSARLAALSVAMFVAAIGAMTVPLIMALHEDMEDVLVAQQERSVAFVARYLNDAAKVRIEYLRRVADGIPEKALTDPAALHAYLSTQHGATEFFNFGLYVIDADGHGITDYPTLSGRATADFSENDYFREAMGEDHLAIGRPRISRFSGKPVVSMATPVHDSTGRVRAVLCGGMSIEGNPLFSILLDSERGQGNGYILVSPRHRLVVTATSPKMELMELPPGHPNPLLDRYLNGYEGAMRAVDALGVEQLVSGSYAAAAGWFVVGVEPSAEVFAPVRHTAWRVAGFSLLAALLFAVAIAWLMRREFSPLERSARSMLKLADGQDMLATIPEDGRDEILAMQRSFNQLQTQIRRQAEKVEAERRLLDTLAARVPGILLLFQYFPDGKGCFLYRSRGGLCPGESQHSPVGQRLTLDQLLSYVVPNSRDAFVETIHTASRDQTPIAIDYEVVISGNLVRWRHFDAVPEAKDDGSTLWYGYISDITKQHAHSAQIEHLAFYDALTELPNRRLLADRLQQALAGGERLGNLTAVCYMDLDGFKPINDSHGHEAGDAVLVETARRLKRAIRANDTVARIGGDEFVLVLTDLASADEGKMVLSRITSALELPFQLPGGKVCHLTTSVGIAFAPQDGVDSDTLLRNADQAMFRAKQNGRDGVHVFRSEPVPLLRRRS